MAAIPQSGDTGQAMCPSRLRWALGPAPGEEDPVAVEPPRDWSTSELGWFDPRGTALFNLTLSSADFWLLQQGGNPVGMLKRAHANTKLRTASEEWRATVYRKRLGWQVEFARLGGQEPALRYSPDTVRQGGSLHVLGERRYKLCAPFLRAHWRLLAPTGKETARINCLGYRAVRPPRPRELRSLDPEAAHEPLLPILILAASLAIVIHHEQPRGHSGA